MSEREHCAKVATEFASRHTVGEIAEALAAEVLRERAAARAEALAELGVEVFGAINPRSKCDCDERIGEVLRTFKEVSK